MNSTIRMFLRMSCLLLIIGMLLFLALKILFNPDRFSERMMRMGGGIIKEATSNTSGVALFGGIVVMSLWGVIALFAYRESRQTKRK